MSGSASAARPAENSLRVLWRRFFHEPVDPRICALVRIGFATLVLIQLVVLFPDLDTFLGEDGVLPRQVALSPALDLDVDNWSVLFWLPAERWVLHTCFWLFALQAGGLLVGLFSRVNAVGVFVWLVSFQVRNFWILDGEDNVFRLVGFFLMFMPAGHVWSLDRLIMRRRKIEPAPASGWAVRLLQIQMAVIFLSAALVKMGGEAWLDGTALYYVARLEDYFGRFPLPRFLFDTPVLVAFLTWLVVAVEFTVPILVWFKETRLPCLAAALLFHLACDYSMNLFLFHWIMLVGWLAFLTPDDLRRVARYLPRSRVSEGPI